MTIYKFQKLKVYQLSLDYIEEVYQLVKVLPSSERFNLSSQLRRSAVSISLNISEGSTGQTDAEQCRFLGLALRSYLESIACLDIIERQNFLEARMLKAVRELGHQIFVKLIALRNSLQ